MQAEDLREATIRCNAARDRTTAYRSSSKEKRSLVFMRFLIKKSQKSTFPAVIYANLELSGDVLPLQVDVKSSTVKALVEHIQSSLFEKVPETEIDHPQISSEICCVHNGEHCENEAYKTNVQVVISMLPIEGDRTPLHSLTSTRRR